MYESDVKEFSSFEIRFRVNNPSSPAGLRPGTPFSISSYYTDFISYTHRNLSDTEANKATFVFTIPLLFDVDSDGIPDLEDLDSDNDGIPDQIEMRGQDIRTYSGIDVDKNGLDDAFMPIEAGINTDGTHPYDYYVIDRVDSDSDNDGIYDLVESGNNAIDANHDGVIDGSPAAFGRNGLLDSLETFPDSGILNYTIADTDADGMANYIDLDSDGDSCNDVTDAGFTDHNNDGLLGNTPLASDLSGIVTSAIDGYVTPNSAYLISGKIQIASQPINQSAYEGQSTVFTITTNPINGYQWQFSTDGIIWTNIADGSDYTGSTTSSLAVKNLRLSMQNYKYRVVLSKIGNLCGLTSHEASLTIQASPITSPQSLIQCDDSAGGISTFNLTERNSSFSTNHSNELFTYYTTEAAATAKDIAFLINDPIAYRSTTGSVWVRIENASSFFSIGELKLMVSATTIPSTFNPTLSICDDDLDNTNDDQDGIATFDFSSVSDDLKALLPAPSSLYSIAYYQTEGDALSEINPITNTTNYRNTAFPNQQKIWVRIENILDNSCYGLGENLTLKVKEVPNIDSNAHHNDDQLVCSNLSSFFVTLDAGIKDNTPTTDYTYVWKKDGGILADQTQSSLEVNTEGIYSVEVTSLSGCSKTREIKVSTSNLAKINQITVENVNESNTATIAVEVTGPGTYQYSLDDPNGPFQTSNVFENVSLGIHEVYVNDQNGCGIISKSIAVIGAPKFFTPNADGYNDYWNVRGLDTDQNKNAFIYIYDRYGKLLKQLKPSDIGWDGTFLGKMLPASDYWYTTVFENGSQTKGHFSLKR